MRICKYIFFVCAFHTVYAMEESELHLLHSLLAKKEVLTTSSYFTVMRKNMVAIYRGVVVQNIFLSASSVANDYVLHHGDVATMLQETEKPIVLFCNAQNEPLKHYVFDCETRERIDQFRKLLDPLCKPRAIKYEMSLLPEGRTYVELKDKDNLLLGSGSYNGDMETIREQVQSDFACFMEIDPDLLAQMEVVAPVATQENQKSWVRSLFNKDE